MEEKQFNPRDYGAAGNGEALDTAAIQAAVNDAAKAAQEGFPSQVVLPAGIYLTGSLFLKSHLEFHMERGAVLRASVEEKDYQVMPGRIAGIEMEWPAGILNIIDQHGVTVSGPGIIDGQGPHWWNKYWGSDRKGGMRRAYEEKGLRWCVDYDCRRIRNVVVMNSREIKLSGFESVRSGFWNIHLCYSRQVSVDNLLIHDNSGPSTDGIDIDSCDGVLVERCRISCNDDSVCIKSGRDADGLRVNRICQNVVIRDCEILEGSGITIGSETSGGARNITVRNISYDGSHCGFRLKSARTRGGIIEAVLVEDLNMKNVMTPFCMDLDWNPAYSYSRLPENYEGEVPEHWRVLTETVSEEQGIPQVRGITVRNVVSVNTPEYKGSSRAFDIRAFMGKPILDMSFENVVIEAKEFGQISGVKNLYWKNVKVSV